MSLFPMFGNSKARIYVDLLILKELTKTSNEFNELIILIPSFLKNIQDLFLWNELKIGSFSTLERVTSA